MEKQYCEYDKSFYDTLGVHASNSGVDIQVKDSTNVRQVITFELTINEAQELANAILEEIVNHYEKLNN